MAALAADLIHPAAAAKPMNPANMSLAKIKETATEFESVFLSGMLEEVFANVEEDGPFDGGEGTKIWRSLRTEEFARAIARAGGVGLAEHVERHLIAMQENRS
jgi:Rod binding domain-containing protein